MSRLLGAVHAAGDRPAAEQALARELRAFTGAKAALLLAADERAGTATIAAADPPLPDQAQNGPIRLDAAADALTGELAIRLDGDGARRLTGAAGLDETAALLLPLRATQQPYVLVLAGEGLRALSVDQVEAAAAALAAAGAALDAPPPPANGTSRHAALARAAKALNESLDLSKVLPRICEEAASILGAEGAAVLRGGSGRALVLEAAHPAPDAVDPCPPLAQQALELGRPLLTDSALAAPVRWDGEARGVLWAGFAKTSPPATERDLALLESFAELAAVASRNASVHAGLAEAARTDGLTGCLNHAALHETLRREMQRSRRTGRRLSIVLVDLDHFKQVNERHGHLMGDEVLRRVGRALREAVRPYDFVARYGGDEFAIVAVDAHEERAREIGERAIQRLGGALDDVLGDPTGPHATAGVAEWDGSAAASEIVRDADRALLYGKQQGIRGRAVKAGTVPADFKLAGHGQAESDPPPADAGTKAAAAWPSAVREETEPLRKRTRQLTLANALGARIAAMTRVDDITRAAVDELHRAFGYLMCAVVRPDQQTGSLTAIAQRGDAGERGERWSDLRATDVVERCLAEGAPAMVNEVLRARRHVAKPGEAGAEIAVPIRVGAEVWGALDVQEERRDAFEEADVRLLETVADQLGSALRSAILYEHLEGAYLRTAQALGAALEAKDAYPPEHLRSIVRNAEAVGRRLGMSGDELRDLRYAAAFHDIGKIAVPERILNKPGPLTESEKREVERHTVVGAQILSEVEFLENVLPLVRHCHEHWDGGGYPDGLAGDRIPLGARVILVCDAHDAMTADRPYREALPPDTAREEIRAAAGRQFDSRVAAAFLEAVSSHQAPAV